MSTYTFQSIYGIIQGEKSVVGNTNGVTITNFKPITDADENSLVWLSPKKKELLTYVSTTPAKLIIVSKDFDAAPYPEKCFILVDDPRLAFIRIVGSLQSNEITWGIHPTATIHPEAEIHPDTYIGPYNFIGKCEVGKGTVIFGHCYLYDGIRVGNNVRIHAGTVIGTDGFGYQRNEAGLLEKFPHIGGVIIGDDVEIGSNTVIDRGTLGDTIIKEGAKIDNLVHIAHNAEIGRHTVVIANCVISGSNKIGDYCWVAPSVSTLENVKVGEWSRLGLGSVVVKDVPERANMIGNPAINYKIQK